MSQDPFPQNDSTTPQISEDTYCVKCEYCLCGLPTDGRCPECNTPIDISLMGDHLNGADPNWIRKVRWGVSLALVLAISGWAITFLSFMTGSPLHKSFVTQSSLILGIVACFLVTAAEPYPMFRRRWRVTRTTARASSIAGAATAFCFPYVAVSAATYLLHLTIFAFCVSIVYSCTLLLYLRSLALRGRCTSLATLTVVVLLSQIVIQALVTISSCLVIAYSPSPNSALFDNATRVQHVGVLASYVISIVYLYILFKYRSLLTDAIQYQDELAAPSNHPSTPPQPETCENP